MSGKANKNFAGGERGGIYPTAESSTNHSEWLVWSGRGTQSRIFAKEHHYRSLWILAPGRAKRDPVRKFLFAFPLTRGRDADCGGTVRPLRCACAFTDACTWVPRHDVRAPPHVCVAATWQFFGLRVGWPIRWGSSSARRPSRGPPAHSCRRQLIQYKEDRWPRRPQRASA